MKMIISAGGTGGHIYPALAIIDEFKKKDKNFEVLYIGTHNRMENEIVPKHNIRYEALKIYGFSKKDMKQNIKNCKYIIDAYNRSIEIMRDFKPDIVIGVGGYVTLPVLMAAKKLKIKSAIHEQNCIPGKTNKFLSRGVNKVFISFLDSEEHFPFKAHCYYTGNPSGDNVKNLKPIKKESLGFHKDKKLVIIVSGSLGSSALNAKIISFLKCLKKENFEVLFITGKEYYDEVIKNNKFSSLVKVVPYLDNLAALFKSADLMISRAGAGVIAELRAAKLPTILVPSPNVANNHQYYNALSLSEKKRAIMVEEENLDGEKLYNKVKELLKDKNEEYITIIKNLEREPNFNSGDSIYSYVKELVDQNAKI